MKTMLMFTSELVGNSDEAHLARSQAYKAAASRLGLVAGIGYTFRCTHPIDITCYKAAVNAASRNEAHECFCRGICVEHSDGYKAAKALLDV